MHEELLASASICSTPKGSNVDKRVLCNGDLKLDQNIKSIRFKHVIVVLSIFFPVYICLI